MRQTESRRLVYGRRGKDLIEIEVYQDRRHRRYISTGIHIAPSQWDAETRRVTGENARQINIQLTSMLCVDSRVQEKENTERTNALMWLESEIQATRCTESYRRQLEVMYDALERYGKFVWLHDFTPVNLARWDDWLTRHDPTLNPVKPRTTQTIANYHKHLRVFLTRAYRLGLIEENPYGKFVFDKGKSEERWSLTKKQYNAFFALKVTPSLQRSYDLFAFQLLTGMSYADTQAFDPSVVEDGWYDSSRVKTHIRFVAPIPPKAQEIIDRWKGTPKMTVQPYNRDLKLFGTMLGLSKDLTSHVARHTFITLALEDDIADNVVQRMVGHASIVMTQRYTHLSTKYIKEGAAKLLQTETTPMATDTLID